MHNCKKMIFACTESIEAKEVYQQKKKYKRHLEFG
jgi:hypothetical protein